MPLYEYLCDACGKRFDVIQKFSDPPPDVCKLCGKGPLHRQMSSPAIQFKGSGFYITDYAKKSSSEAGSASGKSAEAKGDSAAKSESSASASTDTSSKSETSSKSDSSSASTPASTSSTPSKD